MRVKTLCFGATVFSCGYALTHDDVMIVERGINPAAEFALALYKPYISEPSTKIGSMLWEETLQRGFRVGTRLHLPPVSSLMSKFLYDAAVKVYLSCEKVSCVRTDSGWLTEVFTVDGYTKIESDYIINTYADPEDFIDGADKYICAAVADSVKEHVQPADTDGIHFIKGALDGEYITAVKLESGDDLIKARRKFHSEWQLFRALPENNRYTAAALAGAIALDYPAPVLDPKRQTAISASFADIMKAFEGGAAYVVDNY